MIIFKIARELDSWLKTHRDQGKMIGFVPTMGALHDGHISLIKESLEHSDLTISSIFINPTQFNNSVDFEKYPVSLKDDIYLLEKSGCHAVLVPNIEQIYPAGIITGEYFDLGYLENILEGKSRPGHFQGVCQVVKRLLRIVEPHTLFLGQKDYQQCMVIKRLLELISSNTLLDICPTRRESDGLAMSSRNRRLNAAQRAIAPSIFKTLLYLQKEIKEGNVDGLKDEAFLRLRAAGLKVDYVEIASAENLEPVEILNNDSKYIALIAAYVDDIRLIDNLII